jgi:DNA-binding CsgD family transcriptional regulator
VVEALRAAAVQTLGRGAAASAVAYLRRAVAEGAAQGQDGAELLHELGSAEAFARDPHAAADLEEAVRLTEDPVTRARISWELGQVQVLSGDWAQTQALLSETLADLGDRDHNLEALIEGWRAAAEVYDPAQRPTFEARLDHLRSLVDRGGPGTRMLALIMAVLRVMQGTDEAEARALIEHGFDGGRLLRDEGSESLGVVQGVAALVGLEELDAADRVAADALDDARRRGSVIGYVSGCFYRTLIDGLRGRLPASETYLRWLVEHSLESGLMYAIPSGIWAGTNALLERPGLEDIAAMVETLELDAALATTVAGAWVLVGRGRLRLLKGERHGGIADLRAAGAVFGSAGLENPIAALWRSPLALALAEEDRDEARALVEQELRISRRLGLARCEGTALRAQGVLEGGPAGMALLERSLEVLTAVDAPLERARSMVELGAAMRRANQRVASRDPLRGGLELAYLCGAERLAARAMEELHAAGARPRREMATGPDALTAAEARVARMAADGLTNKEIAQALFVTAKTVEKHLGAVYRKLFVQSRGELRGALSPDLSD